MAIVPTSLARVSNLLRIQVAQGQLARTQRGLLQAQNELTTGKRLNAPSDDPGDSAVVLQLQKTLEQRGAYLANLSHAKGHLSEVDTTLGDLTSLLQEAEQIAAANLGSDVPPDQRAGAAAVIDTIFNQVLSLANRQFDGGYLFGGDRATDAPFVAEGGGVRYQGTGNLLENAYDDGTDLPFTVSGADVFGALSTRVRGAADLTPSLTTATRLADLRGTTGEGVRKGPVLIGNGTTTATVDLSAADTVGDVIDAINAAGLGSVTASIAPDGNSLLLTGGAGENLTVLEVGGGTAAADLGILRTTGAGAGVAIDGGSVKPKVTPFTPLAALRGGAGIDQASGIRITNGGVTTTLGFTSETTVQDVLRAINRSPAGVRAQINAAGTGIDILNPAQGTQISIAENGGATAEQLGIRSFSRASPLSELNGGRGVRAVPGPDFRVTASNGQTFDVDLGPNGSTGTVVDVIGLSAAAAGVNVTASFASAGNGIVLTDNTGGAGTFTVTQLNFSQAAQDLGLDQPAAGNVIQGRDVNPVSPEGVFANLMKLRDSLRSSDQAGMTGAAEGLAADHARVVRVRGEAGARVQEMEAREQRLQDQNVATEALLSSLAEVDFTEAVTRFQTLQTTLQATLQTSARVLDLTLLDFLA